MHKNNNVIPQVVAPAQGKATLGSDRVKTPVAYGSGTVSEGRKLCKNQVTTTATKTADTKTGTADRTTLGHQRRDRTDSVSITGSGASCASAVSTIGTKTRITDDMDLTDLLLLIHSTATRMAEAAAIQKNMNMSVKLGIKTILEAADTDNETTETDVETEQRTQNTPRTKRKREVTGTTPESSQKRATDAEPVADWQTVTRTKKEKKKRKTRTDGTNATTDTTAGAEGRRAAPKHWGTTVLVKPENDTTYSDIVRKIRTTVDPAKSHVKVTTLRKTKNGLCLLKIKTDANGQDDFRRVLQDAVGDAGNVRTGTFRVQLEIVDLDWVRTRNDVIQALRRETGRDADFGVHIFGPNRAEQFMAVCDLESQEARALLGRGRIGIGWVACRVRPRLTVTKCHKCLGYGHTKAKCKNTDRTKCYRKCGVTGHYATDYKDRPACPLCAEAGHGDVAHLAGSERCAVYRDWITNKTKTAAIWVRGAARVRITARGVRDDYVWARVGAVTYVSVYLTPNCAAAEFQAKVALLEDGLRDLPGDLVVAEDLNARAVKWGMTVTNRRGRQLLEMAARLDLVVANTGDVPTYRRPGFGDSIPDVTMTTDRTLPRIGRWRVLEGYTASDHQYIAFEVAGETRTTRTRTGHPPRWNVDKLDVLKFSAAAPAPITDVRPELTGRQRAERLADETAKLTTRLCDSTMPKRQYGRNRPPQYWWTDEIAELRKSCLAKRRRVTRAGGRSERETLQAEYKTERKRLTYAIRDSKTRCRKKLCEEVDRDPWGAGDNIVTGRLGARIPPELKDAETARRIVDGLFPTHPTRTDATNDVETVAPLVFTAEELVGATKAMRRGEAPGPDGVPAEVLRPMAILRPEILLDLYNTCLTTGTFSDRWKVARLVLIPKGKGDPSTPSAYRPLSLLDTTGKLFEQLLRPRLTDAIQDGGGLSYQQFSFRRGRSTIRAIQEVVDFFRSTDRHCHAARPVALLVTLDFKNAFNSARWVDILGSLRGDFGVPPYLLRVVEDYLWNIRLTYETNEGQVTRQITAGAAQGSILGPDFWNAMYDSLLRLELPLGVRLVAYAHDVAAVIVERTPDLAQYALNQTMRRVGR
ncbi:uncharacterized protein LOC124309424 [Neodiprion virginianus]|uniref:uncharacterized protein LOC124309424 n=1 Tax=Neodiprion virginianus TaxID=2961670 RepID=UPI001EE6AA2E|nr:uncharacterized protein LOC124309424 [Neodiprion virginianus]